MDKPLPNTYYLSTPNNPLTSSFPGKTRGVELDTDTLIMRVIEADDYEAFQVLFHRMYSPLCQFCIRFVRSPEVAEELVSDVFYTIWKNRSRLIVSSPRAYLYTSVRNKGFDHLRKIKKMVHCDLDKATHLPADVIDSQELLVLQELTDSAEKSIARLPKQCRLVYELSRDQGLKYKEIAAILSVSVKTVETQMGRALKHLRNSIPVR
jgi:RNA polymerase sigma-70 factor (ECF subfamily)